MNWRLSSDEKVKAVHLYHQYGSATQVRRKWKNYFATEPPCRQQIVQLAKKFNETGSIHNIKGSGRSRSVVTEQAISSVTELLKNSNNLSITQGAEATGMSKSSYYRAVIEAGFHAYRPTTVQELSDDDFQNRVKFCETMLAKFDENARLVNKILWSDESQFMLNGTVNRHNCCSWASSNPHEQIPVRNSKLGVMVWCGMTSAGLIGPYFFSDSVTGESYLKMLNDFIWPELMRRRLYFQQDGAPVHYANTVRAWLNEKFPDRWIGRGGPIEWPARSPD